MTTPTQRINASNRLGLDYRAEAARLGAPVVPITDAHSHINGAGASRIYLEAARLYGVEMTYSMTQLAQVDAVRGVLGDSVRFIAVPSYVDPDGGRAFKEGFLESIQAFHELGSRMVKFWAAPRSRDYAKGFGDLSCFRLDGEWVQRAMALAESLGMMFMTHIADPDTWFAAKYTDPAWYGTKADQYVPLERALDQRAVPWLAAHMGGWPEDLGFLDGLLSRHDNLHLDTSATKWMVRELSRHPAGALADFLEKWKGRILFGSDIVTMDEHLGDGVGHREKGAQATSNAEAFDLYASRYWALRTLFETDHHGESPIADPDLAMVDPGSFGEMDAPALIGQGLSPDLLRSIYHDASASLLDAWWVQHP
ncbi:MAG: amidohydrolase family protein [Phycisphaeraceae bacterium]|nr:amidohydrolase family protein [Phycisphaeraceae bacterium]MCB9848672.1 amidohydrolase family protein [Phycisphaeraceae bacterium]